MAKILGNHKFVCSHESELVTLQFGNVPTTMHYNDALRISQIIFVHAKQAKRETGDNSVTLRGFGILNDVETNYKLSLPRHI